MPLMPKVPMFAARGAARGLAPRPVATATPGALQGERDVQFLRMLAGLRRSGGLDRAHDVGRWLEDDARHPSGTLRRWMAHNEVIHFEWQLLTWLPMFQFDLATTAPRLAIGLLLIDEGLAFDHWGTAQWFARAHVELQGRCPAEVLQTDPGLVIELARRDGPRAVTQAWVAPALSER